MNFRLLVTSAVLNTVVVRDHTGMKRLKRQSTIFNLIFLVAMKLCCSLTHSKCRL